MTLPLADAAVPSARAPSARALEEKHGVAYMAARWTPAELEALVDHLATRGARALASIDDGALLAAWSATVEAFLDPASPERAALDPALVRTCGLSPAGLHAALAAVLGGVRHWHASALLARAAERRSAAMATAGEPSGVAADETARRLPAPALVVLAETIPALAVQPLLPALALRKPLLLESSSREPLFAPAFVAALAARLPPLRDAVAAVTWRGGDEALEAPVLARCDRVLAYGGAATIADLRRRAAHVVDYGPKLSLAIVAGEAVDARGGDGRGQDPLLRPERSAGAAAGEAELVALARGLARDVALFDQRGCLSLQAVLVEGEAQARLLAAALSSALAEIATALPAGPIDAATAARVHQLRGEAELRGALAGTPSLAAGTVVLAAPRAPLQPSPGLRTVHVHALSSLTEAWALLAPWKGLLQGAALAGVPAWTLAPALAELGISRCTPPGELQSVDAAWWNGGRDPLDALGP